MRKLVMVSAAVLMLYSSAFAVTAQFWELRAKTDFLDGDFNGTAISTTGEIYAGLKTELVESAAQSLWSGVYVNETSLYAGTADGNIIKLETGKFTEIFSTGELLTASLAYDSAGETLYAATIPNGKIFKIDFQKNASLFCTLPDKYVWQLFYDNRTGLLYAVTGPEGKLYTITAAGEIKEFFNPKRGNVLALELDEKGNVYVGTSGQAILYSVTPTGKPSVLYDFGENEIKSIAYNKETLYVAVNSGLKIPPSEFLAAVTDAAAKEPPKDNGKPPDDAKREIKLPKMPVCSAVYKFDMKTSSLQRVLFLKDAYVTQLAYTSNNTVLAATNSKGKIYEIIDENNFAVALDLPEDHVTQMLMSGGKVMSVLTGSPGNVHFVKQGPSEKVEYVSMVFDAKFFSAWGTLKWETRDSDAVQFQTRSGNIVLPDETWSDWSEPVTKTPAKVNSPSARFVQFKMTLPADKPVKVTAVSVAYMVQNQAPALSEVSIAVEPPKPELQPKSPSGLRKIKWAGADPDGDELWARLYYRMENQTNWIKLNKGEPVKGLEFLWDASTVPDGRYVIRVEATDEKSNSENSTNKSYMASRPFVIDNTKPDFESIEIAAGKSAVSGIAVDAVSFIAKIEYSVNGGEWEIALPLDGISDDLRESFYFELPQMSPGANTVAVRALDEYGNAGSVQKELIVK
ncbi:MAG: hypothetical protein HZA48_04145 [Planctomycetes bacterium]|nr:hypothetical protein [Planctomycetota bacterium]